MGSIKRPSWAREHILTLQMWRAGGPWPELKTVYSEFWILPDTVLSSRYPASTPSDLNHSPCPETVNTQKPMWEKILPSWNKGNASLQVRTRTPRKKECCEHLELPLSVYVIKKTLGLPPGLWFGNYCCHGHPSKQSVPEVPHLNMGLESSTTERKSHTRYIKSTTELTIHDFFSYLEGCLIHRQPVNMF